MPHTTALCGTAWLCLILTLAHAQPPDSALSKGPTTGNQSAVTKLVNFPAKFLTRLRSGSADIDQRLTRQTKKYLQRLMNDEARLRQQFSQIDSAKAASLFAGDPIGRYSKFMNKIDTDSAQLTSLKGGQYLPYLDSLHGSVAFLNAHPELLANGGSAQVNDALANLQHLQAKFADADQIGQFIQQRKDQIRQYLLEQAHLPPSLSSIYQDYNVRLYYFNQQVDQYKQELNDPDKLMRHALQTLDRLPAFASFMSKNSFLTGLFAQPTDFGGDLPGIQNRDQVLSIIQSQLASGGPNAMASFSQSLQSVSSQLQQLKDKLGSFGSNSNNVDMPAGFHPNNQKTKSFLRRLEFGIDMQTNHGSNYYPTSTAFGASLAYKLNDKNDIGIGVAYRVGWTNTNGHLLYVSNQGLGLRSFLDIGIKSSLAITGGFECNYQQTWSSLQILHNLDSWSKSGLIGLTKIVSAGARSNKKTKVQLLWDFLSYSQTPQTTPIVFRIAYNF